MAITIKGTGIVTTSDYKAVKWTGKTKGGKGVEISLPDAINLSNIDLTMVEKDDSVAQLVFSAVYSNTDTMVSSDADYEEPWSIKYAGAESDTGAGTILLGAGVVSINDVDVALTRGGSQFTVEREYREINADGDRGVVKDRVVMDGSRATLTLNALSFISKIPTMFPAITATTTT